MDEPMSDNAVAVESAHPLRCLHELFEDKARAWPERTAVVHKDRRLTYGEINARANRLARHLRSFGVGPDVRVGVCLPRSAHVVPAVLGALKAGGAYVPLDPAHPKDRIAALVADAGIETLITDGASMRTFGPLVKHVVRIDRDWPSIERYGEENFPSGATLENVAYLMYTSGSTGQPKGVTVTHGNITHHISATSEQLGIGADDVAVLIASISFSASIRQYLVPLCRGASVVIASREELEDPLALLALVKRHRVSLLQLVPSHLRALTIALTNLDPQNCASLLDNDVRLVLTASEVLTPDIAAKWLALKHRARLVNMYGLTETSGVFLFCPIEPKDLAQVLPIGRPMRNARVSLLDDNFAQVPDGAAGELCLGGPLVAARGYWNRPQLTEEKFIRDRLRPGSAEPIFRTGDRARLRPDGRYELLGRIDDDVKIRGFKVAPDEVRGALSQHPDVSEVFVAGRDAPSGETRLVAFVVPVPGTTLRAPELRRFLRDRVPEYMVPAVFVKLDALPMLSNGKIDRQSLPLFDEMVPLVEAEYVAPETVLEKTLADIWQRVLQIEPIGVQDNFFDLGGDSLKAMELFVEIRMKCNVELELREIFARPSITELASHITAIPVIGSLSQP